MLQDCWSLAMCVRAWVREHECAWVCARVRCRLSEHRGEGSARAPACMHIPNPDWSSRVWVRGEGGGERKVRLHEPRGHETDGATMAYCPCYSLSENKQVLGGGDETKIEKNKKRGREGEGGTPAWIGAESG